MRNPHPDSLLKLRCPNCEQEFERRALIVDSMNRREGFAPCSDVCRKAYIRKIAITSGLRRLTA